MDTRRMTRKGIVALVRAWTTAVRRALPLGPVSLLEQSINRYRGMPHSALLATA